MPSPVTKTTTRTSRMARTTRIATATATATATREPTRRATNLLSLGGDVLATHVLPCLETRDVVSTATLCHTLYDLQLAGICIYLNDVPRRPANDDSDDEDYETERRLVLNETEIRCFFGDRGFHEVGNRWRVAGAALMTARPNLDEFIPLVDFKRVVELEISDSPQLCDIGALRCASNLMSLRIDFPHWSTGLNTLDALADCRALRSLSISNSDGLSDVSGLRGCPKLVEVSLVHCALSSLDGLATCSALEDLHVESTSLRCIRAIKQLSKLRSLSVYGSAHLADLWPIVTLWERKGALKHVVVNECSGAAMSNARLLLDSVPRESCAVSISSLANDRTRLKNPSAPRSPALSSPLDGAQRPIAASDAT